VYFINNHITHNYYANTDAEATKPEDNNEAIKQVESVLYVTEEAFSDHLE